MHPLAATKNSVTLIGALTNGATGTANVDTLGFDYVSIKLIATTADVVSNKPTVLKIAESDDTVVTNFANVTTFVGGTATSTSVGFVIPSADTSNPNVYRFNVDCRYRKRYLKISVSPQTTQTYSLVADLGEGSEWPDVNTTKAGVHVLVNG